MLHHPLNRRALKQISAVREVDAQVIRALDNGDREVDFLGSAFHAERAQGKAGQNVLALRKVCRGEHDLVEWVAAEVAVRPQLLDQLLEWDVVRIRIHRGAAHSLEQFTEADVARQVVAQHQCVGKRANQFFQFAMLAPSNRYADDNVLLPAVAREQYGESCKQRRKQRDSLAPAEFLERLGKRFGNHHGSYIAAKSLRLRA